MKDIELPPLPKPDFRARPGVMGDVIADANGDPFFSEDDMHDYARAAIEADRAQRVPEGWPTDADLTAIYKKANGEDAGKAQPLTTQRIFKAMRAMLASTPAQPAQQTYSAADVAEAHTAGYKLWLSQRDRPAQQEPVHCSLCGSDVPFSGACGGGRDNPSALCYQASNAQQPAQWEPSEPRTEWGDPRVQIVYELLCADDSPPNRDEHWEGYRARQIVDALFQHQEPPQPVERKPINCWCEACDLAQGNPLGRTRMSLCPECGDKRCPRAKHHDALCNGIRE